MRSKNNSSNFDNLKFIIKIASTLLIISASMAFLLAAVNSITVDKIAENVQKEIDSAIQTIFPDSTQSTTLTGDYDSSVSALYEIKQEDITIGYCVNLSSAGFGGIVNMMVGVDNDGKVAGIKIVSHSETPGLGSRVEKSDYLSRYKGKSGTLVIKQDVDAISGATVSSKAILNGVNTALTVISTAKGEVQ